MKIKIPKKMRKYLKLSCKNSARFEKSHASYRLFIASHFSEKIRKASDFDTNNNKNLKVYPANSLIRNYKLIIAKAH